jgi:hypothetical protein
MAELRVRIEQRMKRFLETTSLSRIGKDKIASKSGLDARVGTIEERLQRSGFSPDQLSDGDEPSSEEEDAVPRRIVKF